MATEPEPNLEPEIAHVLLLDIVAYAKLLVDEQIRLVERMNALVRQTRRVLQSERAGHLVRLPTGDGMALLFFDSPESPVQCALEIAQALREEPGLHLRMGVHSGPIREVKDVNGSKNYVGSALNIAQRVLDCGDAGHILLSKRTADDLGPYRHWNPHLTELGECVVKHGLRVSLVNVCKDGLGNPAVPARLAQQKRRWAAWPRGKDPSTAGQRWGWKPLVAFLALSAAALGLYAVRHQPASIAVLPFGNASDEKGNEHFVNGLQEEIVTNLGHVSGLKVVSGARYSPGQPRDTRKIAHDLDVQYLLQGNVQRVGEHVRVLVQLIEGEHETQQWSDRYDSNESDLFSIQSEIAQRITAQLKVQLSPQERAALRKRPTRDELAYSKYIDARGLISDAVFSSAAHEDLQRAARNLEEATTRDPQFFLAHYLLAHTYDQLYRRFEPGAVRLRQAEAQLQVLDSLQPNAGETHLAKAKHYYWALGDHPKARLELENAQKKLPNDPLVPLLLGYIQRREGHWRDSTANFLRASELDPENLEILRQLALSYQCQRRYHEMGAVLRRVLRLAPEDPLAQVQAAAVELDWHADTAPLRAAVRKVLEQSLGDGRAIAEYWFQLALCERKPAEAERAMEAFGSTGCNAEGVPFPMSWCQGVVARLAGDEAGARAHFTEALRLSQEQLEKEPRYGGAICAVAMARAALGQKAEAIAEGRRAVEATPISQDAVDAPLLHGYLAIIYGWAGEKDLAAEELHQATQVHSYWSYGHLKLHPFWDPLRGDPGFEAVVTTLAPD